MLIHAHVPFMQAGLEAEHKHTPAPGYLGAECPTGMHCPGVFPAEALGEITCAQGVGATGAGSTWAAQEWLFRTAALAQVGFSQHFWLLMLSGEEKAP